MLTPIQLDNQFCLQARKVRDVGPDRILTTELVTIDLPKAKAPKVMLSSSY